ncbi:intercellular adhesion molecule 3 [Anopheles sinensis]|uniref:Intercellular adhesion molecule 3 n=1 Tax=Anopheles sinensis TaxID=74873 RepID=A0A084VTQ2_ANOSI|nr:intercellular adhesion molecule 3 [Anopheles sinensis]
MDGKVRSPKGFALGRKAARSHQLPFVIRHAVASLSQPSSPAGKKVTVACKNGRCLTLNLPKRHAAHPHQTRGRSRKRGVKMS